MNIRLKELEDKISYHFQDKNLLAQALTHSSYANEHRLDHNHCLLYTSCNPDFKSPGNFK